MIKTKNFPKIPEIFPKNPKNLWRSRQGFAYFFDDRGGFG